MSDRTPIPPARLGDASPFRLNIEQQRKRARDLLRAARDADPAARARIERHHPRGFPTPFRLSDAQFAIARELGLPSWPRLKAHIAAMHRSRDHIARGGDAPDRDMPTLHVRCGWDIHDSLRTAGFTGDFLEYSDPVCQGPVGDGPAWPEKRARFLAESYGDGPGSEAAMLARLRQEEDRLRAAPARYRRIVLWCEHDSYDQLILARCLAVFAKTPPFRLDLVFAGHYPGTVRFQGLGQLPPESLRLLWDTRTVVTAGLLRAGSAVWAALCAPDPHGLARIAHDGTSTFPALGRAVRRHCQELPWTDTGLGLTERLILNGLTDGPKPAGLIYSDIMTAHEPLPWLGDVMFRFILDSMKRVRAPVFMSDGASWPKERLALTPLGHDVRVGILDWLALDPPVRWLGGVRIASGDSGWRWDCRTERILFCKKKPKTFDF